jgi:hypothetical protein
MKFRIIKLMAIAFLLGAIALAPINSAWAGTVKSNSGDNAQQAAKEVVKDTGVKQQFGESENGDRLLDNAQEKASQKLNDLQKKANSNQNLSDSEKLFLDNLSDKS